MKLDAEAGVDLALQLRADEWMKRGGWSWVLQQLQGGSNPRPGMNPVDAGVPKASSEEFHNPEISESNVLDVDVGFMGGGARSAEPEQPTPLTDEIAHL